MTLPGWLEPLLDAERMRAADTWAIETRGVPSLELMERAGEGLARLIAEVVPDGRIVVVCGKGNNGGDGFVAARLLRAAGREVDVLLAAGRVELTPDGQEMARRLGDPGPAAFDEALLADAGGVVDALLGTGFEGAPRAPLDAVIDAVNAAHLPVVAADVPSGVDASTGQVDGAAIRARATAAFHRAKPGLWIHPGKGHAGDVHVIDIGIPGGAPGDAGAGLIGPGVLEGRTLRHAASTKFVSGAVAVLGGSSGLTGAPSLSAAAAMRGGAGYVTLAAPASLETSLSARAPVETMLRGLPDAEGHLIPDALEAALEALGSTDAAVLGPGLGRDPGTQRLVRNLVERAAVALVIDADGLNALADGFPGPLPGRDAPTVLTPHAGELGRLLGVPSSEVDGARLAAAREAAARSGAIVVLKGDDTIVATPGGFAAISPGDAPGLATAGTGDVLAGVLAALLARGMPTFDAACAAVWAHRVAGRRAAERVGGADGVIASDVVAELPRALVP